MKESNLIGPPTGARRAGTLDHNTTMLSHLPANCLVFVICVLIGAGGRKDNPIHICGK